MKVCRKRLQKEYIKLKKEPVPYIEAVPNNDNIREWHYIIYGPPKTPYSGGVYHGKLVFPTDYPYKPPSIYMITRNGRFQTKTRLCLSISDFHPETWNPLWSVGSILTGLLSFMLTEEMTTGSIKTSHSTKVSLAKVTMKENMSDPLFCQLFPEVVEKYKALGIQIDDSGAVELNSVPFQTQAVYGAIIVGLLAFFLIYQF